jgi:WD40 repeat protein
MAISDRVLIQPTPEELRQAIAEAATLANGDRRTRVVIRSAKTLDGAVAAATATPEGVRHYRPRDGQRREFPVVSLAWWSDAVGRRHVRVAVRPRDEVDPRIADEQRFPADERPALWQVYPGRVWFRIRKRKPEALVWCRCGACGSPAAVAWMGTSCGPCHDRREEGVEVPAHGPEQTVLAGHTDATFGLAFSPDGRTLATGSMDCRVKLWDMDTGRERATLTGHSARVDTLAYSPDGSILATGDDAGEVRLHDTTGKTKPVLLKNRPTAFLGFGFTPDGRHLAVKHSRLTVWDVDTHKKHNLPTAVGQRGRLAVVVGGTLLATNDRQDRSLVLWDRESGEERGTLSGHANGINCVAASPDGRTLAGGCGDKTVRLWDVEEQQERQVLRGHDGDVWGVAFAPDGKVVASAAEDQTLRLWDAARGAELGVFAWHLDRVFSVAFSPDGRWLATGGENGTVRLWPWRALLEA